MHNAKPAAMRSVIALGFGFCLASIANADNPPPLNAKVTQENITSTICMRGWTKTVRPPVIYTAVVKINRLKEMGKPVGDEHLYELDHVVPLELGGAPTEGRNLQMQLWPEAREKDRTENCLKETVCRGALTLQEAQNRIWADWREARTHCSPGTDHPWIAPPAPKKEP